MNQKDIVGLVLKFQAGDEDAFAKLYDFYYHSIYYFAFKLSRNEADAKDIVQDTFAQVSISITSLKNPKLFKVWLNRIAFSKATRLFARNKTVSFDPDDSWILNKENEEAYSNPHDQIRFDSDMEVLNYCIDALPINQKAVLILMYFEQMNMQEIADTLNVPVGTVKSRLYLGKQKLQGLIEKYETLNHTKLTFHGKSLASLILCAFSSEATAMGLTLLPKHTNLFSSLRSFVGSNIGNLMIVGAICVSCVAGIAIVNELGKPSSSPQAIHQTSLHQKPELFPFQAIQYRDRVFTRADDVYYALLEFAHCEKEIEEKTEVELKEILPLYEGLKEYGSIYYDMLLTSWNQSFEHKLAI